PRLDREGVVLVGHDLDPTPTPACRAGGVAGDRDGPVPTRADRTDRRHARPGGTGPAWNAAREERDHTGAPAPQRGRARVPVHDDGGGMVSTQCGRASLARACALW